MRAPPLLCAMRPRLLRRVGLDLWRLHPASALTSPTCPRRGGCRRRRAKSVAAAPSLARVLRGVQEQLLVRLRGQTDQEGDSHEDYPGIGARRRRPRHGGPHSLAGRCDHRTRLRGCQGDTERRRFGVGSLPRNIPSMPVGLDLLRRTFLAAHAGSFQCACCGRKWKTS
eukprot:scaffold1315_cov405-Prasinococcus_capsulatus_cf.AAC.4